MIERDDHHLKQAFEALRREDAAGTPPFAATIAAARARRTARPRRRALELAAAVIVVVAVVVISIRRERAGVRLEIDLATVRWQAPTDFLLNLPGDELLRSVPQLGPRGLDRRTRPEQRAAITKAIQDFQSKVVDLQWRMQEQSQRLATLLDKPAVDQTAALAQVDEVLGVEREVKRAHITLLINIKNTLSADQQARLAAARAAAMR